MSMMTSDKRISSEGAPLVHSLGTEHLSSYCTNCGRATAAGAAVQLRRCAKCRTVYYCGKACQTDDWRRGAHAAECARLVRLQSAVLGVSWQSCGDEQRLELCPSDEIRLVCRLLPKIATVDDRRKLYNGRCYLDLLSHQEARMGDAAFRKQFFATLLPCIKSFVSGSTAIDAKLLHPATLFEVIAKVRTNTLALVDDALKPIGVALYMGLSRSDHSCLPMYRFVSCRTDSLQGDLVATSKLPQSGDQFGRTPVSGAALAHSYVDNMQSGVRRRQLLRHSYMFECHCAACDDVHRERRLQAMACHNDTRPCDGAVVPLDGDRDSCPKWLQLAACDVCGRHAEEDDKATYAMAGNMIQTVLDTLDGRRMPPETKAEMCSKALAVATGVLHPRNVDLYKLQDVAYASAVANGQWPRALDLSQELYLTASEHLHAYDAYLSAKQLNVVVCAIKAEQFVVASAFCCSSSPTTLVDRISWVYGESHSKVKYVKSLCDLVRDECAK